MPARKFCDACFVDTAEWREVALEGTLETFTILTSSIALLNYVEGVELDDLDEAGAALLPRPRVRVAFDEAPQGRITDFRFVLDAAR